MLASLVSVALLAPPSAPASTEAQPEVQVPATVQCPCARVDWRCWEDHACAPDATPMRSDNPETETQWEPPAAPQANEAPPPPAAVAERPTPRDAPVYRHPQPEPPTGTGMKVGGVVSVSLGGALLLTGFVAVVGGGIVSVFTLGTFGDGVSAGGTTMLILGGAGVGAGIPLITVGKRREREHRRWQLRNRPQLQPTLGLSGRSEMSLGLRGSF